MKLSRRFIVIGVLASALVGGGFLAREQMYRAEIGAIFAVGALSPVLEHHQSADLYDPDKTAQIEREMHELQSELDAKAIFWRIIMIALFSGGGVLFLIGIWRWWKIWQLTKVAVS